MCKPDTPKVVKQQVSVPSAPPPPPAPSPLGVRAAEGTAMSGSKNKAPGKGKKTLRIDMNLSAPDSTGVNVPGA